MNPSEVVISKPQSDGVSVVFQLLAVPIREPREAPNLASHGQVLALHERGRNKLLNRTAEDRRLFRANDLGRRIPTWSCGLRLILFYQRRVIDTGCRERVLDRIRVHLKAVRANLNPVPETRGEVRDEGVDCLRAALPA